MSLIKTKPMLTASWILVHVALGIIVAQSSILAQLWCVGILVLGVHNIIKNKNANNEAALWSAYIACADVPLRACSGALVWEIGKLGIVIFLLLGLLFEKSISKKFPSVALLMLFLLIPGAIITTAWSDRVREDITFNLSGMICLIISMIYFNKRHLEWDVLKSVFSYSLMPIITLCFILYYKTPSLDTINFGTVANFATSGGAGPNQVATILGYGWLIILLLIFLKEKVTFNNVITYGLLTFILYRSLFTFSRGGNVAAVLAFISFYFVYSISSGKRIKSSKFFVTFALVALIFGGVVQYLDSATGGMFAYRFTGRDVMGDKKEDITSGRNEILEMEYELFKENPFGVGVGGSMHFRTVKYGNNLASHNEFGRLLSEHGILGIIAIFILIISPLIHYRKLSLMENRAFCMMFFVLCLASMMHSGCRTAMPEFLYGLSFIYLTPKLHENTIYR